jgi:hypothetical protein
MHRIAILIASAVFCTSALADPPTAASIETLLTVTKTERTLDAMFDNIDRIMQQSMTAALGGQPRTPEQQRALESMRVKTAQIFREEMGWSKLEPMYVQIYQETFTQDEIDGLIAFYRTPVGVAYVDKLPIVLQKASAASQRLVGPMMQRMQAAAKEAAAEAKSAPSAPDKP